MAITRMDEGFEIPDVSRLRHSQKLIHALIHAHTRANPRPQDLKQHDVTVQFDGSVGKAKDAVECGEVECTKHGVFVLSKRLTKSSGNTWLGLWLLACCHCTRATACVCVSMAGHNVYFKLTRTTHDSD